MTKLSENINLDTPSVTDNNKRLKRKKKIRIAAILITALILLYAVSWIGLNVIYSKTKVPDGLSAQETVEKYFDYWDSGNLKGLNLIKTDLCAEEFIEKDGALVGSGKREQLKWYECYSAENLLDNIKITKIEAVNETLNNKTDYNYYEQQVFNVHYSKTIDEGVQGKVSGDNFTFIMVCRETKDSPWRVGAIFTGW